MTVTSPSVKKLTRNDVSWMSPNSKSHQAGINLPLKSFRTMFSYLIEDESENAPREELVTKWFTEEGEIIAEKSCGVVRYHSKNELRLVNIPTRLLAQHLEEGLFLLIRKIESTLHITVLGFNPIHLLSEFEGLVD